MTALELIAALQQLPAEQQQRDVLMEADAGYAIVGGIEQSFTSDDGTPSAFIYPLSEP